MALEFDKTQISALLNALGLPADASDPELVVQTGQDLAAQAAGMNPEQPSTVAAAAKRHGLELVDHDTHEALKRDAAEGRRVMAAAARAKVEAAVDDAVNKGKITAARRKHWVQLLESDSTQAEVLAAFPNELAVPMTEVGHSADTSGDDLAEKAAWFY